MCRLVAVAVVVCIKAALDRGEGRSAKAVGRVFSAKKGQAAFASFRMEEEEPSQQPQNKLCLSFVMEHKPPG